MTAPKTTARPAAKKPATAKSTTASKKPTAKRARPRTANPKPAAAPAAVSFDMIRIEQLRPHPDNIRLEVGDVQELAESIKAQGILQPLTVGPHETLEGDYVIVAGHRRLAAARAAGLELLPCVINRTLGTKAAQISAMLVENLQRSDITPVEEAKAYQFLIDLPDYTVQSIAKNTGRSQKTVKERLKLNKLTDSVKDQVDHGQVTLERAMVLADYAEDPAATAALEKVMAGASPNAWEYEVKRQTKRREWQLRMPQVLDELTEAGVEIIERPEGRTHEWPLQVVYAPSELTYGQRAELGHRAIVDEASGTESAYYAQNGILWVKDKDAAASTPELTPEQIERDRIQGELRQGLNLMAEVRDEHLKTTIRSATEDQAIVAIVDVIMRNLIYSGTYELQDIITAAELPYALAEGDDFDGETAEIEVAALLATLPLPRLVLVTHFLGASREPALRDLNSWDAQNYYGRHSVRWISTLASVYGYELSDVEKQAIAFHQPTATSAPAEDA